MKQIKKLNLLKIAEVIFAVVLVSSPLLVSAQLNKTFPCPTGSGLNCQSTSINGFIATVIQWLLAIAFGIAVLFLIIGGFWYITSAGNEEQAEKGKGTVINAIIGIVIIVLAYVIVNVISGLVQNPNSTSAP